MAGIEAALVRASAEAAACGMNFACYQLRPRRHLQATAHHDARFSSAAALIGRHRPRKTRCPAGVF